MDIKKDGRLLRRAIAQGIRTAAELAAYLRRIEQRNLFACQA